MSLGEGAASRILACLARKEWLMGDPDWETFTRPAFQKCDVPMRKE